MKPSLCTSPLHLYLTIYQAIIWFAEINFCDTKTYIWKMTQKLYKKETFEDKSAAIIIDKDNALANVAKIFSHPNKSWFAVSKKNKQIVNTFSILINGLKMKVMLIHYQYRNIYLESKYPY